MTTLAQIKGTSVKRGDLGFELEVEFTRDMPAKVPDGWDIKPDGSLRYAGAEYVSRAPVKLKDKHEHLKVAVDAINSVPFVKFSPRTSVHVHVNCLGLTPTQICTGLIFSWLVEEALLAKCGKSRKGNRFCLSIRHAPLLFKNFSSLIEDKILTFSADANRWKYANIAYHNLNTLGTIEFRGMEGGTYDFNKLDQWAELVYNCIHLPAMKYKNPVDMVEHIIDDDFNPITINNLIPNLNLTKDQLETNFYLLYNVIYSHDWVEFDKYQDKYDVGAKKKSKSGIAEMANQMNVQPGAVNFAPARPRAMHALDDF